MAQRHRQNAPDIIPSSERPNFEHLNSKDTGASLFESRKQTREPFSWAAANADRRHRRAVQAEFKINKSQPTLSAESSPTEEFVPRIPRSNSDRIVDQFGHARTSNGRSKEDEGVRQVDHGGRRSGSTGSLERDQGTMRQGRTTSGASSDVASPGSRIPISKSMTPGRSSHALQRSRTHDPIHEMHIAISDSETAESILGSPSPAAKQRKEAKYRAAGLSQYSDEEVERMKNWRQRTKQGAEAYQKSKADKPVILEDPNDPYALRRAKLADSEARLSRMATKSTPMFVKNTTYNRVIETARELEKKTSGPKGSDEVASRSTRKSVTSLKQRPAWVEKILNPNISVDESEPPTIDFDQSLDAADTPLPSIEAPANPTPRFSRPAQTHHMSPEKSKLWDGDLDFTGHSIQISDSPQLRVRRLDNMRDQEITDLAARAVATNRLDEIRVRNSEDRAIPLEAPHVAASKSEEQRREKSQEFPVSRETDADDQGVNVPGTPFTVFDAKRYRAKSPWREEVEKGETKGDALDVLRALSRSLSGSPDRPKPDPVEQDNQEVTSHETKRIVREGSQNSDKQTLLNKDSDREEIVSKETKTPLEKGFSETIKPQEFMLEVHDDVKGRSRSSSRPRSDADPEERIAAEAKLFELQDNKSERNSIHAPSAPSSDDEKFDETPKPKKQDPLTLPTPRVMGAFIETPAGTVRKSKQFQDGKPIYEDTKDNGTHEPIKKEEKDDNKTREASATSSAQDSGRSSRPRPPLTNSAKPASALEDIKRLKQEAYIDDSTVDSIDGFLGVPLGKLAGSKLRSEIIEPEIDLEYDEEGLPLSSKERERRLEQLTFERMKQHLANTTSSIRDARHGIERLEQQVSNSLTVPLAHKDANENVYIKLPLPRLWTRTVSDLKEKGGQQNVSRGWKFTWFGLILFIFSTWYIAESTMCEIYCHPISSSKNTWLPSDPFFPWAIPTKLDQWTGEYASTGIYYVWDSFDELLGPPEGRRKMWWNRGPLQPMRASDWWLGRDGPVGIVDSSTEGSSSMSGDEVV